MKWMCGLVGALVLWSVSASAQTVTATWDRNTDTYTVGYRLYYGTASGSYQWSLDTGNQVSAPVTLSPGFYYFAVRAYNSANDEGPPSGEATVDLRPPTAVDCQGTWSPWLPLADWSACVNNVQTRTESRTFTITVYPANGGLACPTSPETRIVSQACTPPPTVPTCSQDPLDVTVTSWPTSKKVQLAASAYVSDYPIARYVYASRGQTVNAITFTDNRGCMKQVTR